MRRFSIFIVTLLAFCACTTAPQAKQNQSKESYVVMVSLDGYRFDYTDRFDAPHLKELARAGVHAEALIPSYPSKTFPNHWSIVTGLYPGHHGIVANEFYDPKRDQVFRVGDHSKDRDATWYGGLPIWSAVEKQGFKAAAYFWPGSDADPQAFPPTYRYPFDDSVPAERRINQVIDWLKLPEESRPRFIALYFSDVDTAGHRYGTRADETRRAVLRVDGWVGALASELKKLPLSINLIVVSDHGMEDFDPAKVEYLDDYADLKDVRVLGRGPQALLYFKPGTDSKTIDKTYQKLKAQAQHYRVYRRKEIPSRFHLDDNPRVGDLMVEAEAPYSIALRSEHGKIAGGGHGYDAKSDPNMNGIFYASGPHFKAGVETKAFPNIDIYPLVIETLGLKVLEPIDGELNTQLKGILKKTFP